MNPNQTTFLTEYLRTGDKIAAYRKAYPNAKETSLKNSANRLLQHHPQMVAAVNAKRMQLLEQAKEDALQQMTTECLDLLRAKQFLTLVVEGRVRREKVWHTRNGFETYDVQPTIAQSLNAVRQYALMEGWYMPRQPAKKEAPPEEDKDVQYDIYIGGVPLDEYNELYGATLDAYFDKEDGTWRSEPGNNHTMDRFLEVQEKRGQRKDEECRQRMTPQLQLEEEQAMRELQGRVADEDEYLPQAGVIEAMQEEYMETKNAAILEELKAVQKMCGLRFLHHRHRYEAERAAGWQFHPFNHNLIRKTGGKFQESNPKFQNPGSKAGEENTSQSAQSVNQANQRFRQKDEQQNRQLSEAVSSVPIKKDKQQYRQQPTTTLSNPVLSNPKFQNPNSKTGEENTEQSAQSVNQINQADQRFRQNGQQESPSGDLRAGPTPEPPPKPPATPLEIRKAGYAPLGELLQDEWDYYIRNQGSTTYRQLHDLKRFGASRSEPPEVRAQVEKETGWLYHPDNPNYAKRHPGKPLVRTKFKGPAG